jgi:hypothetical protein
MRIGPSSVAYDSDGNPEGTYALILDAQGNPTGWKAEQVAPNVYDLTTTHGDYLQHMVFRTDPNYGYIEPIQNTQQQVNFGRWNYAGSGLSAMLQNPMVPLMLSTLAPGAGAAVGAALGIEGTAAATAVGNAVINAGTQIAQGKDIDQALLSAGLGIAGSALGADVNKAIDTSLADLGSAGDLAGNLAGKIAQGYVQTGGKADPLALLESGAIGEAVGAAAREIPGFDSLSQSSQRSVIAAMTNAVQGKDPTLALLNAAKGIGQQLVSQSDTTDLLDNVMGLEAGPTQPQNEADLLDNVMGTEAQPTQPTEETAVAEALDPNTVEGARQIAQDEGWASEAEKNFANIVYGVTTPEEYRAIVGETAATEGPNQNSPEGADQIAQAEGWQSDAEKNFANIVYGVTTPDEYHAIVGETSPTDGSVDLQPSEPAPSGGDLVPAVHTGELPADVVQQLQGAGLEEQQQEPVVPAGPTQTELQNQETIRAAQEAIDKQTADAEEAARQQQLQYEEQQRLADLQAGVTADRERQAQEEKDRIAADLANTQAEGQQQLEAAQKQEQDAQAAGWKDAGEQSDAATWGFSNPQDYRDYMAQANGWANADEQAAAQQQGYSAPYSYHEAMDQAAGWRSSDEKLAAAGMGIYTPAEYNAWLNPEQPPEDVYTPPTEIAPTETQPPVSAPVEEPSIDQLPVDDGTTPGIQEIIDQYIQQPEVVQPQTAEEPATTAQEPSAADEVQNATEVPIEAPITKEATSEVAQETPVETAPVTEEVLPVEEKTQDQMTPEDWAALYATPTTNPETGETIVGADTSEYAPQDLGIEQDMLNEYQQNLIDQENAGQLPSQWQSNDDGTHTMVADDGSTLTIDDTGQIVDYTEAPAGNLPGETPVVTPPTSGQTTAGGTPATGGGTPSGGTPSLPATPAQTTPKSNFDLAALLSILGAASMQQPQQPQVQEPRGEMKEFDFEAPLDVNFFGPAKKNVAGQNQQQATKIATGGYIDDLLKILRG